MTDTAAVHYETDGPVAVLTIDRPEVANAIDRPTAEVLAGRFRSFDADGSLAVAVLSGANGTFCSGADQQWDQPLADALLTEFHHGMATLRTGELLTGVERYAAGGWRS